MLYNNTYITFGLVFGCSHSLHIRGDYRPRYFFLNFALQVYKYYSSVYFKIAFRKVMALDLSSVNDTSFEETGSNTTYNCVFLSSEVISFPGTNDILFYISEIGKCLQPVLIFI